MHRVEAIFTPTRDATRTAATATGGALQSLSTRLGRESGAIAKDRDAMESREAIYKTRLDKQFGGLDGRMGALKATESYLDQQVKLWTQDG